MPIDFGEISFQFAYIHTLLTFLIFLTIEAKKKENVCD